METQTSPEGHNQPGPNVFRKDVIDKATKAIAEYSNVIDGAYANANSVFNRALACTYAAAIELLRDPHGMADFIGSRGRGPKSANPFVPIVRSLWRGVLLRDTVRRHACCLAMANDQKIKPDEFVTWLTAYKGGAVRSDGKSSTAIAEPNRYLAGISHAGLSIAIGQSFPLRLSLRGPAE